MEDFIIPTDGLKKKFEDQYEEFRRSIKSPNVLVAGLTGVGKSSLLNAVFGVKLAPISDVRPETRGFKRYCAPEAPVTLIDSEGCELQKEDDFINNLKAYVSEKMGTDEQVHIAWYCVSLSSARVLDFDINVVRTLQSMKVPTCVVITQCDNDTPDGAGARALAKVVTEKLGGGVPSFQMSHDAELNKELDAAKLIDWTVNHLSDEQLRAGFIVAQKANLNAKEEAVASRIKYYATAAAGIAATPIPASDAVLLTGLQVVMASDILHIYGLNVGLGQVAKDVIGGKVVSMLGKMVAGNLLKLIPGPGTIVGTLINAGVASAITYALGYALNKMARSAVEKGLTFENVDFGSIFNEDELNKNIEEYNNKEKQNHD